MRDERGSMLPLVGALVFVTFTVLALVVDIALLHGAYLEAAAHADAAAEFGAAMVDVEAIHDGELLLDAARARDAALAAVELNETVLALDVSRDVICVTLGSVHRTHALTLVGVREVDVRVRSCARPAEG